MNSNWGVIAVGWSVLFGGLYFLRLRCHPPLSGEFRMQPAKNMKNTMASIWMEEIDTRTGKLEPRIIRYIPSAEYINRLLVPLMRNQTTWEILRRYASILESTTLAGHPAIHNPHIHALCGQSLGDSQSTRQAELGSVVHSCCEGVGSEISLPNVLAHPRRNGSPISNKMLIAVG
ncbi:MAG: hypothetical protein RLZZ398_307 [Verrucomicrobiota bacterium]